MWPSPAIRPEKPPPTCETCRYSRPAVSHAGNPVLQCRRHAPEIDPEHRGRLVSTRWPWVATDDWCGDHQMDYVKLYALQPKEGA